MASEYNVLMVVMIRYWFFALFVMTIASRGAGGLRAAAHTKQPLLQIGRAVLLAAEICVAILALTNLGLVETLAIFICYPLMVAALSGPVLGEQVGWRRWAAIAVGFVGVLISFFWTGTVGSVFMTCVGIWFWEPLISSDWIWMAALCVTGAFGHWLLIKCYETAEVSAVQPFAYFHLVFGAMIGVTVFGEMIALNVSIGAAIVVGAGLFTFWRERQQS